MLGLLSLSAKIYITFIIFILLCNFCNNKQNYIYSIITLIYMLMIPFSYEKSSRWQISSPLVILWEINCHYHRYHHGFVVTIVITIMVSAVSDGLPIRYFAKLSIRRESVSSIGFCPQTLSSGGGVSTSCLFTFRLANIFVAQFGIYSNFSYRLINCD